MTIPRPGWGIRSSAAAVLLVVLGAAIGWGGHVAWLRGLPPTMREHRAGPFDYVHPLLACDLDGDAQFQPLRETVASQLAGRTGVETAAYFRELDGGPWFVIGETERFAPASLRKLPMMLAILKRVERSREDLLGRLVTNDLQSDHDANQNIRPSQKLEPGKTYTVFELIRRAIVYSDNNAFMLLGRVVDPADLNEAYAILDPRYSGGADAQLHPVQTYAALFRILYNATYLGREASNWALALLTQTEFRSGLVAGVPASVEVAHKFGERSDGPGRAQLHDCGIVYYPGHPYLLCVMSRGPSFAVLAEAIAGVSSVVYAEVDRQHARH